MKKAGVILVALVFVLVGCGSKQSGDKEIYKEIKTVYIDYLTNFDKKYNENLLENNGLDKKDLDEFPLAIYRVEGDYILVYDSREGQKMIAYEKADKNLTTNIDDSKVYDRIKDLKPVYSQNDFKL